MNGSVRMIMKVVSGPDAGKIFVITDTCFVGTEEMCLVRLSDPAVAPLLARLTLRQGDFTITDLSDTPELKINNRLAKSMKLIPGDTISAGSTVLRMESCSSDGRAEERLSAADEKRPTIMSDESGRPEVVAEEEDVIPDFVARPTPAKEMSGGSGKQVAEQKRKISEPAAPSISGTSVVDKLLRDASRSKERRSKTRYLGVIIALFMAGVVAIICLASLISIRRSIEKDFHEVVAFAKENPDQTKLIVEKYTQVRDEAGWKSPKVRDYLSSEIVKLLADISAREEELKVLLSRLDVSVSELTAKQKYAEALAVYGNLDAKYRSRVLELRKSVMDDLLRQSTEQAEKAKKQQLEEKERALAANEKNVKAKLGSLLADVAQCLVDGQSKEALQVLENILLDKQFDLVTAKVEEALTTVKLLNTIDRMNSLKPAAAAPAVKGVISSNAAPEGLQENMSPVIKAVLALRQGDVWEARVQLEKAADHLLYASLISRTKMSDESWEKESEAARNFSLMWSGVTGKAVSSVPGVDDCVLQWKSATANMGQEAKVKLSAEVKAFQQKYGSTTFARRFEKLYSVANTVAAETPALSKPAVSKSSMSGFGDGKIIQVDGRVFYVESDENIPEGPGKSIGLFAEKMVFKAVGTNRIDAVRADVHAIVPFTVLGRKQASFSLPEGIKAEPPSVGDRVLIRKDLQAGVKVFTVSPRTSSQKLFEDLFELPKINPAWTSAPGGAKLDRDRLCVDRGEGLPVDWKKGEMKTDLRLLHDCGADPVKVEFDYFRKAEGGLYVGMGDVEFLIGAVDGRKSGIYVKGTLVKPAVFAKPSAKDPQRIVLIKGQSFAYVAAGKSTAECRISISAGESPVKSIQLASEGKLWIDNFSVSSLAGSGGAEITAISTDGKEVLVSRGGEIEWENVQKSQPVYVFGLPDQGKLKPLAMGRIDGFPAGDKLLCSILDGQVSGINETVWLVPDVAVAKEEGAAGTGVVRNKAIQVHLPVAVYGVVESGKAETFSVSQDVFRSGLSGEGYFGIADRLVIHSETGEKLSAWVGKQVRCAFAAVPYDGVRLNCRPPKGFPISGIVSNGVLLSRLPLLMSDRIDLAGRVVQSPVSFLNGNEPFWIMKSGDWKEKPDGIASVRAAQSHLPPILLCSETFSGNGQYDLSLRLEDSGSAPKDGWMKDVMLQLDFPGEKKGLTFAIGAGASGGIALYGRTIEFKDEEKGTKARSDVSFGRFGDPSANTEIRVEKYSDAGNPALSFAKNYEFRIRRAGSAVSFYINGIRLAYARGAELNGEARLMIVAPGRNLTIGKVSARELSFSCVTPEKEPILGEFGYVQRVDASGILVDAAMNGITLNETVSIVAVERVVEGEKSKTVFLKRIALGTVKEIGPMTALIGRTDSGEPVKQGMKILRGAQQQSFLFTDSRIGSIDEGL